jgi:hypothetical protein
MKEEAPRQENIINPESMTLLDLANIFRVLKEKGTIDEFVNEVCTWERICRTERTPEKLKPALTSLFDAYMNKK